MTGCLGHSIFVSQLKSCEINMVFGSASQGSLSPNEQYKAFQPSSNGRKVSGGVPRPGYRGNHQKQTKDVAQMPGKRTNAILICIYIYNTFFYVFLLTLRIQAPPGLIGLRVPILSEKNGILGVIPSLGHTWILRVILLFVYCY